MSRGPVLRRPSPWTHVAGLLRALRERVGRPFRAMAGGPDRWELRARAEAARLDRSLPAAPHRGEPPAAAPPTDDAARSMIAALLPTAFPRDARFDLHATTAPAKVVGGDYFDFFQAASGRMVLVIADASGKGVPAAMLVATTRAVIRDLAMAGLGPGAVLARANAMLAAANPEGMFVTVAVVSYDPESGEACLACAGHPPAIVLDRHGAVREGAGAGARGTVLGVLESLEFEEETLELGPGERLVLLSDGVLEARAPDGRFLERAGVERVCRDHAEGPGASLCRAILGEVGSFQHGVLHDDATVMVLTRAR